MAAINLKKRQALVALTTAAIGLPGINALAAVPASNAEGNVEYGHYQESDHRMQVQVYHADGLVPLTDRLEFSFSLDRDTYSGASPAYSLPSSLVNVISSASTVSAETLTTAGLQQLTDWNNVFAATNGSEQEKSIAAYRALLNQTVPVGTQTLQRFQNQPLETRTMPVLGAKYYFDNTTLGLSGGLSDEPDYLSNFGAINVSHELNDKHTTISAGYNVTRNAIFRNQGHSHSPPGVGLGHIHPADCSISPCTDYANLNANSIFHGFNLGLSQGIGKNTVFNGTLNYTNQSGFLSNPYKTVYVRGEITPEEYYFLSKQGAGSNVDWKAITRLEVVGAELFRENRPDQRNQFSLSGGIKHHIPEIDASLHFDYRYYTDDWNVDSHTFEFKWYQSLPYGITVMPSIRYYSQSQADFFAPYFLAARADGHYSSDFRLSAFGSLNSGITLAKQFAKGVKLEAGVEYYTHEGSLTLGGGGSGDYADFSSYLAHAGINVDLSAPGSVFGDFFSGNEDPHTHHHHHQQFGSLPPAGVMFGHMMPQADDIMVGYMYMANGQAGDMLHGSEAVSDSVLRHGSKLTVGRLGGLPTAQQLAGLTDACPGYGSTRIRTFIDYGCLVKPTSMHMGMHMLDIMYAPSDWLNLMVMPQLVDMDMNMSSDLRPAMYTANGTFSEKHHLNDSASFYAGMRHAVFDLGDTTLMSLVKLYDGDAHHLHAGIGISAPTGSVSAIHNELTTVAVGKQVYDVNIKVLQDFGMQPGSGTWDFKPSLTYTGQMYDIFWGAQLSMTKRLQDKNKSGYALGDIYQSTTWAGYKVFDWLSATVRGVYTQQDRVKGDIYQVVAKAIPAGDTNQIAHGTVSTVDYPQNTGGHYWDVGLGLKAMVPSGQFAGHTLSLEWLQPVKDYANGYQLERTGGFAATWSYMF